MCACGFHSVAAAPSGYSNIQLPGRTARKPAAVIHEVGLWTEPRALDDTGLNSGKFSTLLPECHLGEYDWRQWFR